ncbi:MAG TPA: 30S ribosome-binding factor RbfA [Armatimonadota bacterium]|nr:30S ribosome-binding factor RbfA [Armatimonadota bacterium]
MPNQRQTRVANRVREEIARILLREIEDPRVRLVTITDVSVSPDLKHARVFFSSVSGDSTPEETIKGLRRARKFIQRRLADTADLRFTPRLDFRLDPTAEQAQRVEEILRGLNVPPADSDDAPNDEEPPEDPDEDTDAVEDL